MTSVAQCAIHSATLRGVKAVPVDVEVSVAHGLPAFHIVGMPDAAVQEARERVKSAVQASGFTFPVERIVVNLAPACVRKMGTGFDLPIAIAVLGATGQIDPRAFDGRLIAGELALNGHVREMPGILAFAICAKECGFDFIAPFEQHSLVPIDGLEQYGLATLGELHQRELRRAEFSRGGGAALQPDFCDVYGHDAAKRAFQIAAVGNHGILMVGPPGSGKTMLASRYASILPELTQEEVLETAVIYSVAGEDPGALLAKCRPFRSVHHSATMAGLIGGGSPPKPGEVSLAHNGVLFLDELCEFSPNVLQGLRQPMESGEVRLTRAEGSTVFPARFSLIAASNPCPCGFYGDDATPCRCSMRQVLAYQGKIGGPLLDRFDLSMNVARLSAKDVMKTGSGTSSETLREGVIAAREFREWRRAKGGRGGAEPAHIVEECLLAPEDQAYFERYCTDTHMSGRGVMRALRLARSIADLAFSERVLRGHLCEAFTYRMQMGE